MSASPDYLGWHQKYPLPGTDSINPRWSKLIQSYQGIAATGVFSLIPGRGYVDVPPPLHHLSKNAWSMVTRVRQATNQYPLSPLSEFMTLSSLIAATAVSDRSIAFDSAIGRGLSQDMKAKGWAEDGQNIADGLRLEGVSYTPPGRETPALSRVNLHAPAGSVVAVVGGAGSGKVVRILSISPSNRFYW